jgi:hypothetical protein
MLWGGVQESRFFTSFRMTRIFLGGRAEGAPFVFGAPGSELGGCRGKGRRGRTGEGTRPYVSWRPRAEKNLKSQRARRTAAEDAEFGFATKDTKARRKALTAESAKDAQRSRRTDCSFPALKTGPSVGWLPRQRTPRPDG